jgi:hypothetical protein
MFMKSKEKLKKILSLILCISITFSLPSYAMWGKTEKGGIYWYEADGTIALDGWKLIDDDNDGVGYYYYFNKNGFILLDDITPDYKIVDANGRRIGKDGNPESTVIEKIVYGEEGVDNSIYSADIWEQIRSDRDVDTSPKGLSSSGEFLYVKDPTLLDGPGLADNFVIEANPDGSARYILGPNVVLKKKKNENYYDPLLNRNMQEYIKSGDKYSKKVNGTTFNKSKWKDVMALKGTGAIIIFENPKKNFNKVKGRIATHYFTYSDRTTQCTFQIINEDDGEELYSTSDFNYNSGVSFECTFPKKASAIRFELEVTGQYTSRVCYLRNCEFGFDKEAYEDELYDDETEREFRLRYGTASEADYYDDEEEGDSMREGMGEIPLEGEDPGARYRRLNNIQEDYLYWATYSYDEDDDSITEAMKASISEARRRLEEEEERRNKVSGPAFDEELKKQTLPVGPDGSSRMIEAYAEGE